LKKLFFSCFIAIFSGKFESIVTPMVDNFAEKIAEKRKKERIQSQDEFMHLSIKRQ